MKIRFIKDTSATISVSNGFDGGVEKSERRFRQGEIIEAASIEMESPKRRRQGESIPWDSDRAKRCPNLGAAITLPGLPQTWIDTTCGCVEVLE
jgi:hypothetical protein